MTHLELAAAGAKTPSAVIDLNDLDIKFDAITTQTTQTLGTVTLKVGDASITVTLTGKSGTHSKAWSKADIAQALVDALHDATGSKGKVEGFTIVTSKGVTATADTNTNLLKLGNAAYSVAWDPTSNGIKLSYAGRYNEDGDFLAQTTFDGTDEEAAAINKELGRGTILLDVDLDATKAKNAVVINHNVHDTWNVVHAGAKVNAGFAGIDLKLTAEMIINKGSLTIDGVTFTFYTDKDDYKTAQGSKTEAVAGVYTQVDAKTYAINLTDCADASDEDRAHAAADALSQVAAFKSANDSTATTGGLSDGPRTWKTTVRDDNTIHIEQYKKTNDKDRLIDTYDKLTKLISAKGEVRKEDLYKGTTIKIDEAEVKEGNVLNIGGDKYMFTSDASKIGTSDGTYTYVDISSPAANLKTAIENDGKYVASVKGDTVTVRAKSADERAPTILGKGLTLQIGDTSDSFNQLNVTVYDCHTDSIGVGNLDISTEEAAQAAIADIKAAINYVPDVHGTLGATQNRLDHTINNLSVMTENIQDAESTILAKDVYSQYELEYLNDNVRKSEWVGRENHIYLHYTDWGIFCAYLQVLNLKPLLEQNNSCF